MLRQAPGVKKLKRVEIFKPGFGWTLNISTLFNFFV